MKSWKIHPENSVLEKTSTAWPVGVNPPKGCEREVEKKQIPLKIPQLTAEASQNDVKLQAKAQDQMTAEFSYPEQRKAWPKAVIESHMKWSPKKNVLRPILALFTRCKYYFWFMNSSEMARNNASTRHLSGGYGLESCQHSKQRWPSGKMLSKQNGLQEETSK